MSTWNILPWNTVTSTEDLIAVRTRQLQRRDDDLQEAILSVQRKREQAKEAFDKDHPTRPEGSLKAKDIVLLHNTVLDTNMSAKLDYKWIGPYRIKKAWPQKGTYKLEELDGTEKAGTVAGNRLKLFNVASKSTEKSFESIENPPGVLTQIHEKHKDMLLGDQGTIFQEGGDEMDVDKDLNRNVRTSPTIGTRLHMAKKRKVLHDEEQQKFIPEGRSFAVII